jgi:archaemetzincin
MANLNLVCLSFQECHLLPLISASLSEILASPIVNQQEKIPLGKYFNEEREQYNAAAILTDYEQREIEGKAILITSVDLYIPIFTYVFGLAKLNGRAGIVSARRLQNTFYGLPDNVELLKQRLIKEIVHELGHLLNLRHCNNFKCVMASSTTADDLDIKENDYCPNCLGLLARMNQIK